jgi:tetratricopeptide (TPR) repeat protein
MTEKLHESRLEPLEKLNSTSEFESWSPETAETLNDLLRALRRKKGFGLFFVQCNPAQGQRVIAAIKDRLPKKRLVQIELNRESETLYRELLEHYQAEPFEVVCVTGAEQAMYGYEDTKRLAGWTSDEIYNYSWKGLPPLLSHLNRQREAFEENLPVSLIFLVPSFVIDYFVQRAPDFFDWRSGFFKITEKQKDSQTYLQELSAKGYKDYIDLASEERVERILKIKEQILHLDLLDVKQKSNLLREQGRLFESGNDYALALDCYDRALMESPENHKAWNSKGSLLYDLERYDEALMGYDNALKFKPDYHNIWNNRGLTLRSLERYEEAIESYDRAIELKPDYHSAWYGRGIALRRLGQYEEAIESFDRALDLKADLYHAWNNRGIALRSLERYEEAIESYDRAIELKPDYYPAWYGRSIDLSNLGYYEEAVESIDHALDLQPDIYHAWHLRGFSLSQLERHEEAIQSYNRAIELHPNSFYTWDDRGMALSELERYEEAIESFDHALEIQSDYHSAWQNKGYSLYQLGRYKDALNCFHKLSEIQPDNAYAWNNQSFLALVEYSYGLCPVLEKPLLIRQTQDCKNVVFADSPDRQICHHALDLLSQATCLDPKFTLAWANSSFPAYYLSQYQDALEYCNKALELDPKNEEAMNDVIYSNQGCILLQLRAYVNALNAFDTALTLNPQLDEAWIGKGTALYQLERYEEAIYSFTQALHLNHPLAQVNLDLLRDCIN